VGKEGRRDWGGGVGTVEEGCDWGRREVGLVHGQIRGKVHKNTGSGSCFSIRGDVGKGG
jgi:hypothetical protein